MFEKEAEEYYDTTAPIISEISSLDFENGIKLAFKDGAEFGYNKGFEECAKARLNVTTISDCPIKDEWHFVKDELPELYKDVLVVFSQGNCDVKHLTNHNEWVGRGSWCSLTDVIAWKEIVLPELKERE